MTEGNFEGIGGLNIFTRSWRPEGTPRGRRRDRPRLQLPQRPVRVGRAAARRRGPRGLRAGSSRPRQVGRRALLRREVRRLRRRRAEVRDDREVARSPGCRCSCSATAPAASSPASTRSSTRRSSPGLDLRELRARGAGAGLRARGAQGPEPHRAARARAASSRTRTSPAIPRVVAAMNADPLIAHEIQPTQTVAEMVRADERLKEEFAAHHPAGAHPPRHGRQGDEAERQQALLRRWPARRTRR